MDIKPGCFVTLTRSLDSGKFQAGEIAKIINFDTDGNIKISLDSMDEVLTWRWQVRDAMRVISENEVATKRKSNIHCGCYVQLTRDLDSGKYVEGETGKIVGFTEEGGIKIFLDSMDRVLNWNREMRNYMKVLSASEAGF